jgi:ACR3 family arsenite transporter
VTAHAGAAPVPAAAAPLGAFERWLTLWVFLCIVAGIALGQVFPAASRRSAGWRSPG